MLWEDQVLNPKNMRLIFLLEHLASKMGVKNECCCYRDMVVVYMLFFPEFKNSFDLTILNYSYRWANFNEILHNTEQSLFSRDIPV